MEADGANEVLRQRRLRTQARMEQGRAFLREHPLVGMSVDEACRLVRDAGIQFRPIEVGDPTSGDMVPGRITVRTKNGVVLRAYVGN